ncbi:hypothetical protein THAOC_16027 [Thalassiosira oceanica]|uniref:Uncharacterized protein n=1 Tax=Thalassiosira oceanica TaxID=159749 RepID=K0SQK6_THAOC|nr:hypothetical protein THAOC_16027 [Thalassiosira oceanica]|eukprot:EJK63321.1 hypothetical protein THAOC_16027 [Thalassiosira oceanica]
MPHNAAGTASWLHQQYPQQINHLCKMLLHPEHQVAPDATPLGLERAALVTYVITLELFCVPARLRHTVVISVPELFVRPVPVRCVL